MAIAFAGLFALQFIEPSVPLDNLILLAILALALVVCGIGLGLRTGSSALLWLGYAGFSIEVLALYFKTVGTLLAAAAYRLHSRTQTGVGATP
jgi:uncharacterized membrane protein